MSDFAVSSVGATKSQAVAALDALIGKDIVNVETGIAARVSGDQKRKIVSNAAVGKSNANGFSSSQHFAVAAKIDTAWKNGSLVKTGKDKSGDVNIASIKRFEAAIQLDGKPAVAYMTIKESVEHGHRIYSLELRETKMPTVEDGTPSGDKDERAAPRGCPLAVTDDNHLPRLSRNPSGKSSRPIAGKP